jgi:transposase-like protein
VDHHEKDRRRASGRASEGCERPEDLLGDGGLLRDLKKALMQRMLGAELTEHLSHEHGQEPPPVQTNRRNGVSRKTLRSEAGCSRSPCRATGRAASSRG